MDGGNIEHWVEGPYKNMYFLNFTIDFRSYYFHPGNGICQWKVTTFFPKLFLKNFTASKKHNKWTITTI
jgi:hypothetical protein